MNERAQAFNRPGDRAIIDLMLAHIPDGVEATYNRAAYLPRRIETRAGVGGPSARWVCASSRATRRTAPLGVAAEGAMA